MQIAVRRGMMIGERNLQKGIEYMNMVEVNNTSCAEKIVSSESGSDFILMLDCSIVKGISMYLLPPRFHTARWLIKS